jgi:hypothetical protein
MRRLLALGAVVIGVSALAGAAVSAPGPPPTGAFPCHAKWVDGQWVRAGHFRGGIDPDYDVVIGRFRLQVGGYRDRASGLTQKVLWEIDRKYPVDGELVVRGKRLHSKRRFTQRLPMAGNDDPSVYVFPSIIAPPAQGCWKLTLRSGRVVGRLRVWVHGFG